MFQIYYIHSIQIPFGSHYAHPPPSISSSNTQTKLLTHSPPIRCNMGLLELHCPFGTSRNMRRCQPALPLTNLYPISSNLSRRDRLVGCNDNVDGRDDDVYIDLQDRDG